jgi:hypothetical protein
MLILVSLPTGLDQIYSLAFCSLPGNINSIPLPVGILASGDMVSWESNMILGRAGYMLGGALGKVSGMGLKSNVYEP